LSLCPSCNREVGNVAKFCPACGASIVHGPTEDAYTGRIIAGKYRVEALIGEGGMGKVFRATQLSLDKTIVLKVLRQSLLSDARTVARFQREAKAASRLNHPNSISVLDFGQSDDGSLYIAMEHVSGVDLHQLLSTEGPLPERRIVRIVSQVLSALADAHAAGVIHRDLKPENIMVEQRRGEPDFVKVLDFGIAKIQESDGSESQALTRAGFVCGTPEYMSPEQARGGALDARSDLYAVGVICYQCATNMLPFEADSAVALATMHLTTPPTPPRARRPDAPIGDALEALILRAMSKDPNDRPQSAEEFRAELLAVLEQAAETRVQSVPTMPAHEVRPRKVSRPAARVVEGEATTLTRTPSWATSPGFGEEMTVAATNPGGPARKGAGGKKALGFAVGLGAALLAASGLLAFRHFSAKPSIAVLVPAADDLASGNPPAARQAPADIDLSGEPDVGPAARLESKQLVAKGDNAVVAQQYDEALLFYTRAYEAHPSAQTRKRIAFGYMMKGDAANSRKWLREYLEAGADVADAEYVARHLDKQ
jgi:serine/threonine protein kinase